MCALDVALRDEVQLFKPGFEEALEGMPVVEVKNHEIS